MATSRWIRRSVVAVVATAILAASQPSAGITIVGGTAVQREMVHWAVGRFESERLTPPPIEIRFHVGLDACRGLLAYYSNGVADECREHTDLMAARSLLHEMSHAWLEANMTEADIDRFLELRGLSTWNDQTAPWEERGNEQGAEIMAWALGDQSDGTLMPSIPENARDEVIEAYELLTGLPFPALRAGMEWRGE